MVITIDGPAGVGKSTAAYMLAKRFGLKYLDSGAFYRAITYKYLMKKDMKEILNSKIYQKNKKIFLDSFNVTKKIRSKEVEDLVSEIASKKEIRDYINHLLLEELKKTEGIVTEGRDMGSIVFAKEADFKFYIDASLYERARRRSKEKKEKFKEILKSLEQRDKKDKTRLEIPNGAVYIDTTNLTKKQVFRKILEYIKDFEKKEGLSLRFRILHALGRIIFKIFFDLKVFGMRDIPYGKGVVIISNHLSYLDPPILGACTKRRLRYLARSSLFRNKLFAWIIKSLCAIPIKEKEFDKDALKKVVNLLKEKRAVVIFPEGTRSKDGRLQEFKEGVAFILNLCFKQNINFSLVFAKITGTDKAMPKGSFFIKPARVRVFFKRFDNLERLKEKDRKEVIKEIYQSYKDWEGRYVCGRYR